MSLPYNRNERVYGVTLHTKKPGITECWRQHVGLYFFGGGPKCWASADTELTFCVMEVRPMLPKWFTAFLVLLHELWSTRRDAHIRFLKLQIEMLQSRLPGNRVVLSPDERRRLMKVGAELQHRVEDTVQIVSIKTYRRWQPEEQGGREPGKSHVKPPGRQVALSRAS